MVIILAAGKSSRMRLKDISKCAIKINDEDTSVSRLIRQFELCGEHEFLIVIGHSCHCLVDSLRLTDRLFNPQTKIHYIYNPDVDRG